MTIIQLTGRFKFICDNASERLTFNPGTNRVGSRIYAIDTKLTYDWDGSTWLEPASGGIAQHGNEYHNPDFATQSDVDSSINTHKAVTQSVHGFDASGNAPAQSHGNTKHSSTFITQTEIDSSINTHKVVNQSVHGFDASGNAPAQSHGNEKHSATFIIQANAVVPNGAITGATKTKVTYDAKGLVTTGADATTADVPDSADKRYCTDAQKTVIGNTSGVNSGDGAANNSSMYIGTTQHALNRASAAETLEGITLTTPNIGAATGTSLAATGAIKSSGGGLGYASGAGGTITQSSSKSTGVTLNKLCGTIVMNGAALAAGTIVTFTITDSFVAATDVIHVQHDSVGTIGAYTIMPNTPAAGSFKISVRNNTAGSLSEAIVLRFAIIKAVAA
jgi:hypothetical protein